jgi:hypothetical protein
MMKKQKNSEQLKLGEYILMMGISIDDLLYDIQTEITL